MSLRFSPTLMREPDFESLNDQGRGTKWSVGHGGGLEVWGGGLWSAAEGRPRAPWSSGRDRRCVWADGLRGLSRDGSFSCERGTAGDAGDDGPRELALPYELRYLATTLMRSAVRHSLWRTCSDTVCASSRDGCILAARNTSGGVYPGRGVEE